jgi:hypothetical protein
MTRDIKAENAHPMNDANQTQGRGTQSLNAQTQKTAPIIDADRHQAQAAAARVQANRRQISPIVEA